MKNKRTLIGFILCSVMLFTACGKTTPTESATTKSETSQNSILQGLSDIKEAASDLKEAASTLTGGFADVSEITQGLLPSGGSYEEIYEEYSAKLRETTPGLIQEYMNEASNNTAGLEGLATIANSKVEKLSLMVNTGVEKMAQCMMTSGSGKYDEYQEWAMKMYGVYEEEAQKIYDAYTNSVTG